MKLAQVVVIIGIVAILISCKPTPPRPPGPVGPGINQSFNYHDSGKCWSGKCFLDNSSKDLDSKFQDDWKYQPGRGGYFSNQGFGSGGPIGSMAPQSMAPMMESKMGSGIGFSAGGAKDVENFRENIKKGFLPIPSDITYEGLFYDYSFDTGEQQPCLKLFCPSYSFASSKDPFSGQFNQYLSVGLNSGISDFHRKKLNLVVVLDISGSMSSPFDEYYYDRFGKMIPAVGKMIPAAENINPNQTSLPNSNSPFESGSEFGKSKMQVATESLAMLLTHLKPDDRLGIVLFDDAGYLAQPFQKVSDTHMNLLRDHILELGPAGGTNMEAGMKLGTSLFDKISEKDAGPASFKNSYKNPYENPYENEYENRIIFLTDAMPNLGQTSEEGLFGIMNKNANNRIYPIYSTFIGIGVDLNTQLVDALTKIKGANSYAVHSSSEFKKRLDEEFEFMVTPLVFNLELDLEGSGFEIEKVYGSPEADEATGHLLKVNTLFPSKKEEGQTRGGLILVKLKKISDNQRLNLVVHYEDHSGITDQSSQEVRVPEASQVPKSSASQAPIDSVDIDNHFDIDRFDLDHFDNLGIRKGVLLARYADLLKNWLADENEIHTKTKKPPVYRIILENGISIPPIEDFKLGKWERQSKPLSVSDHYRDLFRRFQPYFEQEIKEIGDSNLQKEGEVLKKLLDEHNSGAH